MATRVAIIYNESVKVARIDHWTWKSSPNEQLAGEQFHDPSEEGVRDQVRYIAGVLSENGFAVSIFGVRDVSDLVEFLNRERPKAIFNCCEAFRGKAALEMNIAAIYELFEIPYTGTPALSLGLAVNKALAKAIFRANGIPTPEYAVVTSKVDLAGVEHLKFPLIVKPAAEDASIGIDAGCVVHDRRGLIQRIEFVQEQFEANVLVEEFISGREFNLAVLSTQSRETSPLPLSEIAFDGLPDGHPQIVTFEAKWYPDSRAFKATMPRCPAEIRHDLAEKIVAIGLKAAHAIGLRDYGRVDLRVRSEDDAVFVLEVNPNPDISSDAGFVRAVEASGRTHAEAIRNIMLRALERCRE